MGPLSKIALQFLTVLSVCCNGVLSSPFRSICVGLVPELIDWSAIFIAFYEDIGRGERIRTSGPCLPKAETGSSQLIFAGDILVIWSVEWNTLDLLKVLFCIDKN